jgi:hypothetical protein
LSADDINLGCIIASTVWSGVMILGLTILSVLTLIAVVDVYRTFYHGAKS